MLNGFLPCGLVYLAASASMNKGSVGYSLAFMLLFGLGTLPAMIGVVYSKNIFPANWRLSLKKLTPVFLSMLGLLFILRGMDLNIPYVSPHIAQASNGLIHSCCKVPK
jgi:sulfite exporter TauE/SafE